MSLKRVLFISANPQDAQRLRIDQEKREIEEQLNLANDQVVMDSIGAARTTDIQRALLRFSPQVVHFSGDVVGDQGLVLEDLVGRSKLVNAEAIAALFELHVQEGLNCVVLNACYSEGQAETIAQCVEFVVGMSKDINDSAAIQFSVGFYQALGAGRSVEFAYESGCVSIQMEGLPEYLTPVLYSHGKRIYGPDIADSAEDEPPTICPKGAESATEGILQACESAYRDPDGIRLIEWGLAENGRDIDILFRERRRGWYFQMTLEEKSPENWDSVNKVSPLFLPILERDEFEWNDLTKKATLEDWYAMDSLIRLGISATESKISIVNRFTIGENAIDKAMEKFGLYVPDDHLLPAFLFLNEQEGVLLLSYFKHPDGFAKENIVCDQRSNECVVFDSLKEAQESLRTKIVKHG